jgi:hypothetical protein
LNQWLHIFTNRKSATRRPRPRRQAARALIEPLERRILLSAAPLTSTLPLNLAVTSNPEVQQNPSIATDPTNPEHIVVSYMDQSLVNTGYEGIGVAVSENGGATWQTDSIPLPAAFDQGASNPTTVFDAQGHVFVVFEAATFLGAQKPGLTNPDASERPDGFQSDNGIFVARSDDGGLTWDTPVAVASNLYDGTDPVPFDIFPDLAIDTFRLLPDGQPNPNYGNEYVTFTQLYPAGQFPGDPTSTGGGAIMLAVSTDDGQTWQLRLQPQAGTGIPVTVIGPNDPYFTGEAPLGLTGQNYAQESVGPEGDLYVSYYMFGWFAVIHSTNAGETFTSVDLQNSDGLPFNSGIYVGNISADTGAAGPTNDFRTLPSRDIIADPTRPGTLYVAEAVETDNADGVPLDYGDIFFARSTDYGITWTSTFDVGGQPAELLNDDNGGFPSNGGADQVADGQAMPQMAIDAQGDLAVIWYDTRHDPNNHLLDVYGTVSTDGGKTFSANFRITTDSFDADAGQFTDAEGQTTDFLGDRIGLSVADGTAYATWTDTNAGNQNIDFATFSVLSPPPPTNDRFGPNDTSASATNLGTVIERTVPKLRVLAEDQEWFEITAAATGNLTITATPTSSSSGLTLQLYSADGSTLLASGTDLSNGNGNPLGQQIVVPGTAGQSYLVRISPDGPASVSYSLGLQSLTADLGTAVVGNESGVLAAGDQDLYQFESAAAGSINVTLTPGSDVVGDLIVQVLSPTETDASGNPTVLAAGQPSGAGQAESVAVSVTQNQLLLLEVSGVSTATGSFTLAFTNLDLFSASLGTSLAFPAGDGPSQVVIADVNNDGKPDLIVSDALDNTVSVLLGNGDGTFQSPRQYSIGAMNTKDAVTSFSELHTFQRGLAVADLTGNGTMDIVVTNPTSGDVSVLLGNGDGTFKPQERFDAGPAPNSIVVGDFNGDGIPDLAVLSASAGYSTLAILIGPGDGTFLPPQLIITPVFNSLSYDDIQAADLTGNGKLDLLVTGGADQKTYVYLGNGDGTFRLGSSFVGGGPSFAMADLNGDGIPDVVNANISNSTISYVLGNGNGTFGSTTSNSSGEAPLAVAVADVGSQITLPDGSTELGPPDGHPDLIVADSGLSQTDFSGPAEIVLLPSIFDSGGFEGFGSPIVLATASRPESLAVGDLTGDGTLDIVYVDNDGVHIIFGSPPVIAPNNTPQTARNLGVVVHTLEPTLTIVPGHEDAYYTITVPTEAVLGAGNEVINFSGDFEAMAGAGLAMEVLNSQGVELASGQQFQVVATQGEVLTLHVSGAVGPGNTQGAGAYTLDIDVLPQVVSVQADALLPGEGSFAGGPTTSLVITFQGDRLDPVSAEDPANYTVTWLGPDGVLGTADDRIIPLASESGFQSVVYDPSANIDVASGKTYPTAVRQTVTLLFDQALFAGSYLITLSPNIKSAAFNDDEQAALTASAFAENHLVSLSGRQIVDGARFAAANLVSNIGSLGNLGIFQTGTAFLTQFHSDLGAMLDSLLTQEGDRTTVTSSLLNQMLHLFEPALAGEDLPPFLVMFLDPVSLDLVDPDGTRIDYSLQTNSLSNQIPDSFVSVASNVEVVVLPIVPGQFVLNVSNVAEASRGGVLIVGSDQEQSIQLTDGLRDGTRQFQFGITDAAALQDSLTTPAPAAGGRLSVGSALLAFLRPSWWRVPTPGR